MLKMIFRLLLIFIAISMNGCESRKTDEERIREEVDSTSVHLTIGLKLLTTNPDDDPEIDKAQNTLHSIMDAVEARSKLSKESQTLTFSELGRLAKVGFKAKQLGALEVAKGQESDFRFLAHLFSIPNNQNPNDIPLTVEHDHALTLAGLFVFKLYPGVPVPISKKALLYEAWMAGDAEFGNEHIDLLIRSLQATVFARNGYCDFALHHTNLMRDSKLGPVDMVTLKKSMSMVMGIGRFAAHAPEAAAVLIPVAALPVAIELFPGMVRTLAHVETSRCFNECDNDLEAQKQQQYAIDTVEEMGAPEADVALLRAAMAYKNDDLESSARYLRKTQESKLLDDRTKKDLVLLADNLDKPDKSLIERYFSSAATALTVSKIVNQRLKDEGFYEKLYAIEGINSAQKIYTGLMSMNMGDKANGAMEDAKDKAKGLFDKLKQSTE